MEKFKKVCHKTASILEVLIGIALAVCLFVGGLGFVGYVVALIIGGEQATILCTWIYKSFYPVLIKVSTISTLTTMVMKYLRGEAKWVNPLGNCKKGVKSSLNGK